MKVIKYSLFLIGSLILFVLTFFAVVFLEINKILGTVKEFIFNGKLLQNLRGRRKF